jgi:transposase
MDRQTRREGVHRFNAHGPDGLRDSGSKGPEPRLSEEPRAEIAQLVETGPDRAVPGVVRWRRIDLPRVILGRFGVAYPERTIGTLLKTLGFSTSAPARVTRLRISGRSRRSKNLPRHAEGPFGRPHEAKAHRHLVPG